MEHKLAEHIANKLPSSQICVVVNKDGFLAQEDTRQQLLAHDIELIPGAGLDLRLKYEIGDWKASRICFVIQQESDILPDIREDAGLTYFSLFYDVLSRYDEDVIREGLSYHQAAYLLANLPTRNLNRIDTKQMISAAEDMFGANLTKQKKNLESVKLDWKSVDTIASISENLLEAFRTDQQEQISYEMAVINGNFQQFLDQYYGSFRTSTHVNRPKLVSKVLPHICYKHEKEDRIALLVVDGMSYWQYLLLRKELVKVGIEPKDDFTMAWLPSITQLSRQAIFKGAAPADMYAQNPSSEKTLWFDYWQSPDRDSKRMNFYDIAYYYGGIPVIDQDKTKLAVVNVELDEYMHSCHLYSDLYLLTQSWAKRYARDVKDLHQRGYHIYITSDHGNIFARPWRTLQTDEKNLLVKSSRGSRHLIYSEPQYLQLFLQKNLDQLSNLRTSDKYAIWKNDFCFRNDVAVTHGGSHFLEVIVPFINIPA